MTIPNSEDETIATLSTLRVDNLFPYLEAYLSSRARNVFKNQKFEMGDDCFFFGRIAIEKSSETLQDFAERVNTLVSMLDGRHLYKRMDQDVYPCIEACLCSPMELPVGKRQKLISDHGIPRHVTDETDTSARVMFLAYLFVEGLDWGMHSNRSREDLREEKRLWLNGIIGKVMLATREGELPINSEEVSNVVDLSES